MGKSPAVDASVLRSYYYSILPKEGAFSREVESETFLRGTSLAGDGRGVDFAGNDACRPDGVARFGRFVVGPGGRDRVGVFSGRSHPGIYKRDVPTGPLDAD